MRFAIGIPQLYPDGSFSPSDFKSYLARVEELGVYESAWTQEMVLGGAPQLAPLEAMTYAAACTSTLRLGCTVFVTTLHTPVHLAKSLASLDQLSGGRLEVGIGSGGPRRPFAAFGMSADRWLPRFTEGVALMKALWTEPSVTFDGEFWQLKDAAMEPKPYQKPYPRLWFGGSAATAVRRGWGCATGSSARGHQLRLRSRRRSRWSARRFLSYLRPGAVRASAPVEFPIAKRVYLGVDRVVGARARDRMNDALARLYGARVPAIEAAAVAGTVAECVDGVRAVIEAGAEMILFTPLYDNVEHMELIADQIIPALGRPSGTILARRPGC